MHFKCALFKTKPGAGEWTCSDHDEGMEAGTMSVPSHSRLTVNALQRKKVLLDLIQKKKVAECGHLFFAEYQKRLNQLVGRVDKKTIMRAAKGLEADQLIKIHTITLPRSSTTGNIDRQLFLDASIGIDDQIVKNFIEMLHDRNVFGLSKFEAAEYVVMDGIEVADEEEIQRITGYGGEGVAEGIQGTGDIQLGIDSGIMPEPMFQFDTEGLDLRFNEGQDMFPGGPPGGFDMGFPAVGQPFAPVIDYLSAPQGFGIGVGANQNAFDGGMFFADGPFAGFNDAGAGPFAGFVGVEAGTGNEIV